MIEKWNEVMKELNSGFKWLRITLNYGFLKPQDWIHDFNWILISFAKFWSLWNCNGMFQISFRFLNSLKNLGDSKIKKLFYDWSEILKYFGDFSSVLFRDFWILCNNQKILKKNVGFKCLDDVFHQFLLFLRNYLYVQASLSFPKYSFELLAAMCGLADTWNQRNPKRILNN